MNKSLLLISSSVLFSFSLFSCNKGVSYESIVKFVNENYNQEDYKEVKSISSKYFFNKNEIKKDDFNFINNFLNDLAITHKVSYVIDSFTLSYTLTAGDEFISFSSRSVIVSEKYLANIEHFRSNNVSITYYIENPKVKCDINSEGLENKFTTNEKGQIDYIFESQFIVTNEESNNYICHQELNYEF